MKKRAPSGRPVDGLNRSDYGLALGLLVLAFTHRLLFLFSNVDSGWGFTIFYEGDSETFYNYARAILAGVPYDGGIPFHPPAWPRVLAFVHEAVGAGSIHSSVPHVQVKIWNAFFGALVVPGLFLVVARYLGRGTALLSALLATYSFGLYVISVAPVSETFYQLLLVISCGLLLGLRHPFSISVTTPPRVGLPLAVRAAGLGWILALLALTRAEGMGVALLWIGIGLAAALPSALRGRRTPLLVWGLVALALALSLTPWTIRNHRALSGFNERLASQIAAPLPTFAPITAYGPLNFALANNDLADGTFSRSILTSDAQSDQLNLTDPQHFDFFRNGYGIGGDWIRSHPERFLELVGARWQLFSGAFTLGWTQWNLPSGLEGIRRPVDMFVPDRSYLSLILIPLILVGWILGLHHGGAPRRWSLLTLGLTGIGLAAAGAFFGYARLGVVLLPFWFTHLAVTLRGVWVLVRREPIDTVFGWQTGPWTGPDRGRHRLIWSLPLAFLLLLEIWGALGDRDYTATGTQLEGAAHLNPHATMRIEVISR